MAFGYKKERRILPLIVENKLPVNIVPADLHLFEKDLTKTFAEVSLNFLEQVNVTPHGVIFKGLKIFEEFLIWPAHKKEFNVFYLLRNFFLRKKIEGNPDTKYIVCFDYWSLGYFHWMCDFLPRLLIAQPYLSEYTLLLPENHKSSFIKDSLQLFGFKGIQWFSNKEYIACKHLLVPDFACPSGDNNPQLMNILREKFNQFYKPVNDVIAYHPNVYVSRSKAKGRYIENETEVIQVLQLLGFKVIYFEEYSLKEQISIAYHCKNLVGLHGANLTNLMFMTPRTNILELRKQNDTENNYYFSLASSFKLNYFYLQCESKQTMNNQAFDLHVDIKELTELTKSMLNYIEN